MDVPRLTIEASLALMQAGGLSCKTFVDIGAAEGAFFVQRLRFTLFPGARHFFVDAMAENEPVYQRIATMTDAGYAITALSSVEGTATLKIDPGFYNSHIAGVQNCVYPTRVVPMTTLDNLVASRSLEGPYVLKLDVQGGELDVLRGARKTLADTTIVVAECAILTERDTLADLLTFMQGNGFVLVDVVALGHYPSSHLMFECYATFIPRAKDFRAGLQNSTPEQLTRQVEGLRARREKVIDAINRIVDSNHAGS